MEKYGITSISNEAKKILLDGCLLEKTEEIALGVSNNYNFARRIFQEIALIISGQLLKYLNGTSRIRAYSHAGIYSTHGFGKDYSWDLANSSGLFPFDKLKTTRLDNITDAVLYGTVSSGLIAPPPTVTENVIFIGEYSTFMRGNEQRGLAADMRSILENGSYSRRLAKVAELKEHLHDPLKKHYLEEEMIRFKELGMKIDLDKCEISVKTTTSWIIASARFGSDSISGRSLLSMGDIDRFRWRSYIPSIEERKEIVAEVGSYGPSNIDSSSIKIVREAWDYLTSIFQVNNDIKIPRDEENQTKRKQLWNCALEEINDQYQNNLKDEYLDQLITLRASAEFTRLMYQHALLKQFERDQGYDFSYPDKFVINYAEDGEFAKKLWVEEYVPSLMMVIDDILSKPSYPAIRVKFGEQAELKIMKLLSNGSMDRGRLFEAMRQGGIELSVAYLDKILRKLREKGIIAKGDWGIYRLPG